MPFLQRISDGAEAAAEAAGMNAKVVYGDGSTNSAQAAVRQAIAQKADGIVLVVIDPTTIQKSIDEAKAAGIVVTDVINRSVGDPLPSGVTGQMVVDLPAEMDAMAGWILADSECNVGHVDVLAVGSARSPWPPPLAWRRPTRSCARAACSSSRTSTTATSPAP